MRSIFAATVAVTMMLAAAAPAHAVDADALAPGPDSAVAAEDGIGATVGADEPSSAGEAGSEPADGSASEAAPAVRMETGSLDGKSESSEPALSAAHTVAPAGVSPLAAGIRQLLESEAAAAAAAAAEAPPLPEGARPPPKSAEARDRDAMQAFYGARNGEPIWVSQGRLSDNAAAVAAEISLAGEWGLDPAAIELPALAGKPAGTEAAESELAAAELMLSRAVLKYHLLARGGAIYDAPKQISSYLDRRPQLRDRRKVLEDMATADDPVGYLLGMHPQHPEFKRLHQAWLDARSGKGGRSKVGTDQLLANMQQWRLMPEDMGPFHVWLNVPEYMIRIVKDGETVFNERVTVGLVNKQTPIFSDAMERVTFKSRWRVPDSIKVKEVWPSLLSGGGMMRQHGLIMMKGEEEIDWQQIDWSKASMEDYTLWQPPGPKNQLGLVKFSFPNKHYVFMHDTPDKHMFAWTRRANSHGCMRIRNPLQMATVILGHDKGWDRARIDDLVKNGPDHNIVELDNKVPVHITYLTVRIDQDGRIQTFADIYGHEKRVRQALAGDWARIATGPDHLAPLDQTRVPRVASASRKSRALREPRTLTELMFGGN